MTTVAAEKEETAALVQVGNGFPPVSEWEQATELDDEKLAAMVADGAVKLAVFSATLKPYYFELRERFHKKSEAAEIHGCRTWDEFCKKVVKRTRRAINYWLAGGNPSEKRNSRKNGTKEQRTGEAPKPENGKPSFAIGSSPIDGDAAWSKQDTSRQILAWSLSCLKKFSPTEKREIAEDVTAKLRDEMMFEAPQPPPITGNPVHEPEPGTMEELRQRLSRMADTQEIEKALGEFLADLVTPLLEHHAYTPSHHVSVSVRRTSSPRIGVGDWVEYKGGYKRVSEQIGGERSLGRVIGEDMLRRPRVRWYSGNEWLKPYSLFDQFSVSVLFDFQAAERYPEAFNGYPKET